MRGEDAIGKEVANVRLRPSVDDESRDEMQVGARVDVVRNGGRDDREDVRGALSAVVEPGEEPVPSPKNQATKLALSPIVRRLDVAVVEEEHETMPLPVKVAEGLPQRRLRRRVLSTLIEPAAECLQHGAGVLVAPRATFFGGVTGARRCPFDGEELRDDLQSFERDLIPRASRVHQASPTVALIRSTG